MKKSLRIKICLSPGTRRVEQHISAHNSLSAWTLWTSCICFPHFWTGIPAKFQACSVHVRLICFTSEILKPFCTIFLKLHQCGWIIKQEYKIVNSYIQVFWVPKNHSIKIRFFSIWPLKWSIVIFCSSWKSLSCFHMKHCASNKKIRT